VRCLVVPRSTRAPAWTVEEAAAHQAKPEFPLFAAVAEALGLRLALVPEPPEAQKVVREHHAGSKQLVGH
jgi:hypothetical protein